MSEQVGNGSSLFLHLSLQGDAFEWSVPLGWAPRVLSTTTVKQHLFSFIESRDPAEN